MPIQLECLESVLQAVSVLEAVVRRSFGPDGGQVLFTRDTGQTLLTRHGTCILTALRLEHPLARVVVECVRRHSSETGDGSKTFILLLASLLREIQKHTRKARQEAVGAKRLAEDLLAFGLDRLSDVISVGLAARGTYLSGTCYPTTHTDSHTLVNTDTCILQQLLGAFLHTRISPTHADVLSQLTFELLSHWSYRGSPINQHFPALHTTLVGFPIGCSRLLEGQVIHADFSTPLPVHDQGPIKALMVKEPMEPSLFIGGSVLELGGTSGGMESVNMSQRQHWLKPGGMACVFWSVCLKMTSASSLCSVDPILSPTGLRLDWRMLPWLPFAGHWSWVRTGSSTWGFLRQRGGVYPTVWCCVA
ncbi:hypothetical protein UPYG_G00343850 [Umbra pygmaea]|uniref:Bardet-Biedl syndrome 10 n=1 Tax=Umbra pygmaea TaxID=75934 RepID=A0ABD0W1Q0_UMBPY